jgi:FkbM family methyltransferase
MPSLRSLTGGVLRTLDRVAGTDFHRCLRASLCVGRALAPDRAGRLRMVAGAALLATKRWRRPVRIRVRGPRGPRWFVVPDHAGMLVLDEVFCAGEYATPLPVRPRHILDLGSNIGVSVLYFALRYPDARITAVEASPTLFRVLEANVGDLPNVSLRHAAANPKAEPVTFYEGVSSWAGSTQPSEWVHADRATEVPGVALDDLLAAGDVDLVKVDVEGAEFELFPGSARLRSVPAILGEIHAPPRTPESDRMLALFDGFEVRSTEPDPTVPQHTTVFSAVSRS